MAPTEFVTVPQARELVTAHSGRWTVQGLPELRQWTTIEAILDPSIREQTVNTMVQLQLLLMDPDRYGVAAYRADLHGNSAWLPKNERAIRKKIGGEMLRLWERRAQILHAIEPSKNRLARGMGKFCRAVGLSVGYTEEQKYDIEVDFMHKVEADLIFAHTTSEETFFGAAVNPYKDGLSDDELHSLLMKKQEFCGRIMAQMDAFVSKHSIKAA